MTGQRGEGRLGVFIWLLIFGAGIFFAVRTVPAKVAVYEFHDFIEQETRFAATRGSGAREAKLFQEILDKAQELELPVTKENLKLKSNSRSIKVHVNYQVPVDLAVYEWVWRYDKEFESLKM